MLKKGVNSTTETRKWASATLVWSLNPWISCAWSILSKRTPPSLPHLFSWQVPRYQKTYLLCTISLEYSATVEKKLKFPSILKSHWKSSLTPFLHQALQLLLGTTNWRICSKLSWKKFLILFAPPPSPHSSPKPFLLLPSRAYTQDFMVILNSFGIAGYTPVCDNWFQPRC